MPMCAKLPVDLSCVSLNAGQLFKCIPNYLPLLCRQKWWGIHCQECEEKFTSNAFHSNVFIKEAQFAPKFAIYAIIQNNALLTF